MSERELLIKLKTLRRKRDEAKEALRGAQSNYDQVEMEAIEHLTTIGAETTAEYDGIGKAQVMKPRIYASFLKENEEEVKQLLRDKGRSDLIRETISAPGLSGFVGEQIEAGKAIDEKINYYLKVGIKLYD